ncbi:hypothetical protein [Nitrosomonas sp.]|uniref:hypothetical protein n=1 Tax=Nitrosomonas sp. TaxID=42353 RepID=UPI001D7AAE32|nr:hypothetical protein [Nitrosomonas sp.]MCB1949033.1 hypothetical protein [Nitrosomonas sp.]
MIKGFLHHCFIAIILTIPSIARAQNVDTEGGIVKGSRIIHVSNLDNDGAGSFREALKGCGPCVIVFDISGLIELEDDLEISKPYVTVAGETSPSPGIILHGGTLRIRAHNILISNISIYPGSSFDPKIAENRDGISIYGSQSKDNNIHNVVLQNISVGWGVDENISVQGITDGIRIERSIIAQPLRNGGHPKGVHSMNILLSGFTRRVLLLGNIIAGAEQRNPRLTTGNQVSLVNNVIAGTGNVATHLDTSAVIEHEGAIDIIENLYKTSSVSSCKHTAIHIDKHFLEAIPKTLVYIGGNRIDNELKPNCLSLVNAEREKLSHRNLFPDINWEYIPIQDLEMHVFKYAGSHPLNRNPIDRAVLDEIQDGTIAPLENDLQKIKLTKSIKPKRVSDQIFKSRRIITTSEVPMIRQTLCQKYTSVTGLQSCPYNYAK